MTTFTEGQFDAVVVGAGHAGVESALALARTGFNTVMLTLNLDSIAFMACNPSIGGTAKGQIVREIDALGGRDYTTVIYARDKISELIKTNDKLRVEINDIKKMLLKQ